MLVRSIVTAAREPEQRERARDERALGEPSFQDAPAPSRIARMASA